MHLFEVLRRPKGGAGAAHRRIRQMHEGARIAS